MMPDINAVTTAWLRAQGDAFKLISEVQDILPTFVPAQQVSVEVEFMLHNNLASSYDGWLLDPYVYGSIAQYQSFEPLDPWVNNPLLGLEWDDVLPFVRARHASFKGRVVSMPLDVRMHLLFFRRDLLLRLAGGANGTAPPGDGAAAAAPPPPSPAPAGDVGAGGGGAAAQQEPAAPLTWTELLEVAARLNGTDLNGDGRPDYGICMDVRASASRCVASRPACVALPPPDAQLHRRPPCAKRTPPLAPCRLRAPVRRHHGHRRLDAPVHRHQPGRVL